MKCAARPVPRVGVQLIVLAMLPVAAAGAFPCPEIDLSAPLYTCRETTTQPVIDGRLDDACWQRADWTDPFGDIQGPQEPQPRLTTRAKMCWDDEYFYVGAQLDEPDLWATYDQREAVIYHENDFEVFIDPDGDNHLYMELEINALGTVWDLLLIKPYRDGGPAVNAWDIQGLQSAIHLDGTLNDPSDTDHGWSVELALPWSVLGQCAGRRTPPRTGDTWRMNFSRVQWHLQVIDGQYAKQTDPDTGKPLPEDNWVWSPQGLIAMHYPEMWGQVRFVEARPSPVSPRMIEARAIDRAHTLMEIYYRQRQWHEEHGRYAADLANLGLAAAEIAGDGELTLETTPGGFKATLRTPGMTASIDEQGRLHRSPLGEIFPASTDPDPKDD